MTVAVLSKIVKYNNNNNNIYLLQLGCHPVAVVILHVYKTWNWLLLNLSREGYMRSMWWQLGVLGTISAFAFRHRKTKKNLCRGGRSQDLPNYKAYQNLIFSVVLINKEVTQRCSNKPHCVVSLEWNAGNDIGLLWNQFTLWTVQQIRGCFSRCRDIKTAIHCRSDFDYFFSDMLGL